MTAVLVNPSLVVQRNDRFTTGIVYMPIGLAYVAAALRKVEVPLQVVDAFGERPQQVRLHDRFAHFGLDPAEVVHRFPDSARVAFIYANQLLNHASLAAIIQEIKKQRSSLPVVVLENTQAVTAYELRPIAKELFAVGADYLLSGEAEMGATELYAALTGADPSSAELVPGLVTPDIRNAIRPFNKDLDGLPFPAWDLFPVQNYWNLKFAHGPFTGRKYLPMLTSRGCPYPCNFCVVPATNAMTWRARSAVNVVDEMEHFQKTLGVTEFHWEDLNPTIQDKRTRQICSDITMRGLKVTWKLVAGTKVESIRDETTIDMMAEAGCRYISISPESGSKRVLDLIDKPFKTDHAVRLLKRMSQRRIRSQACFVLGFPDEQDTDRALTRDMIYQLTRVGVDEIAIFIISPVPGSKIFGQFSGYSSLSELNFTPTWRADYMSLNRFRLKLYLSFLIWKTLFHPVKLARQCINFAMRRFETKMEMVPYRAMRLRFME